MPSYDFICDKCGYIHEITCSMDKITEKAVFCVHCSKKTPQDPEDGGLDFLSIRMRRLYGGGGVIFKGKDWPGQDIKRGRVDSDIQEQRRKACVLKDQGVVPRDHVIKLGAEAKDRYAKKFADKDLGKLYDKSVRSPSPPKEEP